MPQEVSVFRIPMRGPGDAEGLARLIEAGDLDPMDIVAILGKTEGNGGVNDFTREYATWALSAALAPHLGLAPKDVEERIAFVMSGGTEGCSARTSPSSPGRQQPLRKPRASACRSASR